MRPSAGWVPRLDDSPYVTAQARRLLSLGLVAAPAQLVREKIKKTRKKALTEQQKDANDLMACMDAADDALKLVQDKWAAKTGPDRDGERIEIQLALSSLNRNIDLARARSSRIRNSVPLGYDYDNGVEAALKDYSGWYNPTWQAWVDLSQTVFAYYDKGGDPVLNDLADETSDLFQRLVLAGKLTLNKNQGYWKPSGQSHAFNETNEWTLHLHLIGSKWEGHYKPAEDEYGLGYKRTNSVDELTLAKLGIGQNA